MLTEANNSSSVGQPTSTFYNFFRDLLGPSQPIPKVIGIIMTLYHLIVLSYYPVDPWLLRVVHLAFISTLCFLLKPFSQRGESKRFLFFDILLIIAGISVAVYIFIVFADIIWRFGVDPTLLDVLFGTLAVLMVLEITRRATGFILPIISGIFLLYMFVGPYMPKFLSHPGFRFTEVISFLFSPDGIYGIPLGVSCTYVFIFILFGAFLRISGAATVFTDFSLAVAGRARGGPAKVAVIASSLFGTISGAAVANVVTTGSFTIPMMKKIGYRPHFAGAVEAVASTGGQLMPPIMGAGAFVMSEILGIPYSAIIIAATIPALLYYFTNFWIIDLEAAKNNLSGLPSSQLPRVINVLKTQGYMALPLFIIIFLLVGMKASVIRAGLWSIVSIILVSLVRRETRMGPRKIIEAMYSGAFGMIEISATCACAGIIIGVLSFSGLGMKMANALIVLSGQNLAALLFLTMVVCLILGMGMPTVGAYVICASVAAPSLSKMGVDPLAAHMFIFYYACLSSITPPVCLASYAAASIANANVWHVGFTAVKTGFAGFIVPYMFVYGSSLLMIGDWKKIIVATGTACVGCFCLASGLQGWFVKRIKHYQRILMILAGVMLIDSNITTDLIAGGCILIVLFTTSSLKKE